ncbi:MAG: DciA family protein [Pseudomonadota bacterium]
MPGKTPYDKSGIAPAPTAAGGVRRRGWRSAGDPCHAPVARTVERFGFADPQVLARWPEIVGEDLAARCRPVKVVHGRGRDLAARLLVAANGAAALEIEYRAPQIVDRVNAVYGYRHVSRLSITQGISPTSQGFAEESEAFNPPSRGTPRAALEATAEAVRAATHAAAPVNDADLRAALGRLGAYVLTRPRQEDDENLPSRSTTIGVGPAVPSR